MLHARQVNLSRPMRRGNGVDSPDFNRRHARASALAEPDPGALTQSGPVRAALQPAEPTRRAFGKSSGGKRKELAGRLMGDPDGSEAGETQPAVAKRLIGADGRLRARS